MLMYILWAWISQAWFHCCFAFNTYFYRDSIFQFPTGFAASCMCAISSIKNITMDIIFAQGYHCEFSHKHNYYNTQQFYVSTHFSTLLPYFPSVAVKWETATRTLLHTAQRVPSVYMAVFCTPLAPPLFMVFGL